MMYASTITAEWSGSLSAQRILSSFRANPPQIATIPPQERWTSRATGYVGYRVECLNRLLNDYRTPILAEADRTGDWSAWDNLMTQPSVEDAIDEALGMIPHLLPIVTTAQQLNPTAWGEPA